MKMKEIKDMKYLLYSAQKANIIFVWKENRVFISSTVNSK